MSSQDMINRSRKQEDDWISLSDLMTGLMMIFMLLAIIFMLQAQRETKKSKAQAAKGARIVSVYENMRSQLFDDLYKEFEADLPKWKARLNRDLSLRFEEPNVQFDTGQSAIKIEFAEILRSFVPRYVAILYSEKYRGEIDEIRIEGHTSPAWGNASAEDAYYENMKLSQDRARSVLRFVFGLGDIRADSDTVSWLVQKLTANGLSFSKVIYSNDKIDNRASQRVEFRVKTKSDERLDNVLKALTQ